MSGTMLVLAILKSLEDVSRNFKRRTHNFTWHSEGGSDKFEAEFKDYAEAEGTIH